SFSIGRRNRKAGDKVYLRLEDTDGGISELRSILSGASEVERGNNLRAADVSKILVLPSRRTFNPFFSKSESTRSAYMSQTGFPSIRSSSVDPFSYRLFRAQKDRDKFNEV